MNLFLFAIFLAASALFSSKRLYRYLRYLQQDAYSVSRFWKWYTEKGAFDTRGTLAVASAAISALFISAYAYLVGALLLLFWYFREEDPRKSGKLKLVMTGRAKRIFAAALILYILLQAIVASLSPGVFWPLQILLFQLLPFLPPAAVAVLSYDETRRQKKLVREAKLSLREVSPYVIGITGSYGKTSTKEALGTIINVVLGAAFWPPKGVNTEMGITREIRHSLKKGIRFAVIEMAAYAKGSIRKLCQLTPPQAGIITTVGVAHLDRFGSEDTIREAKSELAEAIPYEGILVCNGDNRGAREIARAYPKKTTLLYGFDNTKGDLDCLIKVEKTSGSGTDFIFVWKDKTYRGSTVLVGRNALSNLAASFAMSCALGAEPELVIAAIANLKPVENRLEVHRDKGITYLKDAYNSNPDGFFDALDVLAHLEAKKKILMTPGMVELSAIEQELHQKIGKKAAEICDLAILVGETNRESLTKGLISGGMSRDRIIAVESREKAFVELTARLEERDAVLIENDLPDLYQDIIRF